MPPPTGRFKAPSAVNVNSIQKALRRVEAAQPNKHEELIRRNSGPHSSVVYNVLRVVGKQALISGTRIRCQVSVCSSGSGKETREGGCRTTPSPPQVAGSGPTERKPGGWGGGGFSTEQEGDPRAPEASGVQDRPLECFIELFHTISGCFVVGNKYLMTLICIPPLFSHI